MDVVGFGDLICLFVLLVAESDSQRSMYFVFDLIH